MSGVAICEICPHHCHIVLGASGRCGARGNRAGEIISLSYGRLTALALDPIEKKPLSRFHPGSKILSVGSFGCNMSCAFCQNAGISQQGAEQVRYQVSPTELAEQAARLRDQGNIGVAFTYNEPLINFEFLRDTAIAVHERGMLNIVVTNGLLEEKPFRQLLPLIDAYNIDLKGFSDEYYNWLGGDLETVKCNIVLAASAAHVELTTLIVAGKNDSEEEMRELSAWIAAISPDIPLHVSRCFPGWRMPDLPATPVKTVYRLADIARERLKYVYTGNC